MENNYWIKKQCQELFEQAQKQEREGDYSSAVESYRRCILVEPENAQILYNLGIAYAEIMDVDNAIINWRKAIWLEPKFRSELAEAFLIDDELAETVIEDETTYWESHKAA